MPQRREEIAGILRQRVIAGLHLGLLRPGTRLPSVRTLAAEFEADPRVVLATYRQLATDKLVEVRPRSGVFVADTAVSAGETLPQTAEWIVGVLVEGIGRGIAAIEFPERVRRCLTTVPLRAACVECNRDQIAGLCSELARDYGFTTTAVDLAALNSAAPPSGVQAADLLVTTSYHAREVQQVAESMGKPWIAVSHRPEFIAEATRLLEKGPLYFVAADPRFAEKLGRMFASAPGSENLRVLVTGRDDVSTIPADAPVYVMPSARAGLEESALQARVVPAPRVFSPETASTLLSFIVSANMAARRDQPGVRAPGPLAFPAARADAADP